MEEFKSAFANEAKETIRKIYFSTNDIVWYNNERLKAKEIEKYDLSTQKEMVEQELKNYISFKMEELCHPITEEKLKEQNIISLIDILSSLEPDNKKEIVDSFTKYMIKVILKLQGTKIEWKLAEVKECTFVSINDFEFFFLTPKDYNYFEAFYRVWNFFQIKTLDENRKRA